MPNIHVIPSKRLSTVIMLVVFVVTWIYPIWPMEQAMHGSLTIVGFYVLHRHVKRYGMADRDFFLIAVFIAVHSVAARWLYSNIPYDQWLQSALGFSLNHYLGWTRNNFDRLVHFLYGFCLTPAIVTYVVGKGKQSRQLAFYIAITAIMVTSLWYEWLEWLVAVTFSAKDAESYLGQQGDMWDAHKDMLLATIGSLLWAKTYLSLRLGGANKT